MRCYNGCPDDELRVILDERFVIHETLAAADMHATYFPMEGKWIVFRGQQAITDFHDSLRAAADAALKENENAI